MEVKEQGQKKVKGNMLYTFLVRVKLAYQLTKLDLGYVRDVSNLWKGKKYMWGRTHLSVAFHNFYWHVIKNI